MTRLFMTKLFSWPASQPVSHFTLTLLFTLALLACGLKPAFAEEPEKKIDWYQVEVIIFSQQDLFNEERHTKDIELSFPENIRQLLDSELKEELKQEPQTVLTDDQAFQVLPESAMGMISDRDRLRRAPGYRVLFHKAWRQPGLGRTESPWIFIQGGNKTKERHELEGSFRLVRNRYLHIQANLWKTKFLPTGYQLAQPVTLSSGADAYSSGNHSGNTAPPRQGMTSSLGSVQLQWPPLPALPVFSSEGASSEGVSSEKKSTDAEEEFIIERKVQTQPSLASNTPASDIVVLNQSTRVTRKELTYLDHPNMGAIVLVTKYEPEKEIAE